MADDGLRPRTYYLNEQHELTREEKTGGGGSLKLAPIDWASKGRAIRDSLSDAKDAITRSRDPLKDHRFFLLAQPVAELIKESKQKKRAPEGTYAEKPNYASGEHSRVFQRLGLDLLQVNDDGSATVHATAEGMDKLLLASESLDQVGTREQSRWATIDTFGVIPPSLRIDETWLDDLSVREVADAVLELQPLLTRAEIDEVVRAVASFLKHDLGEKLTGTGTDFSGRQWFRGRVAKQSLRAIAKHFYSVQSVHPPLLSLAALANGGRRGQRAPLPPQIKTADSPPLMDMPTVAILDTGVPDDHRILVPFRRGRYVDQQSAGRWVGDHGSFVASRIVFGDIDSPERRSPAPAGECRFYEVMVAIDPENIYDKSVVPSMEAVVGTAPDVRVFNLSFDNRLPLDALSEIVRREKLLLLQDLDNFIFARDVLVVVAAGNSPRGVIPSSPYPQHYNDPQWQLGTWARSFNALTCGSTVERLVPTGLVRNIGWPSPFTRVGPGLCDSPKPDFCAHGGNGTDAYQFLPGLGVYGCSASGLWEDRSGTSFAAPMLAREAAFALQILQGVCEPGAKPFGGDGEGVFGPYGNTARFGCARNALGAARLGIGQSECRETPQSVRALCCYALARHHR
jgi:hypothetical protein